jgi:hypothetical protein
MNTYVIIAYRVSLIPNYSYEYLRDQCLSSEIDSQS